MSEVPHCPSCLEADSVSVRNGPTCEYYCRSCNLVIVPDDVIDIAWIDMVSDSMFKNPEEVKETASKDYSDSCDCDWCSRGRRGLESF